MQYIDIKHYTYRFEESQIAQQPLAERDAARLLVYQTGQIQADIYANLFQFLPADTLLVFNNTKVLPVRLHFAPNIEIFCLQPYPDAFKISETLTTQGAATWECLVGRARKWKSNVILCQTVDNIRLYAEKVSKIERAGQDTFVVRLFWEPATLSFAEVLNTFGQTPLPPYLNRPAQTNDRTRYQTIFASVPGAVAAPTAGLHFTDALKTKLKDKSIEFAELTLHVGAGTFLPVVVNNAALHTMHAEYFELSRFTLTQLLGALEQNRSIVAVGTTAMRTLESLAYVTQVHQNHIPQWVEENFKSANKNLFEIATKLKFLLDTFDSPNFSGQTQIMITPGFPFQVCKGLLTNFHQPQSTLLLLVAAFIGEDWRKVYDFAYQHKFRLLSYGDSSLLWRNHN